MKLRSGSVLLSPGVSWYRLKKNMVIPGRLVRYHSRSRTNFHTQKGRICKSKSRKNLGCHPTVLQHITKFLESNSPYFQFCVASRDGRINSITDEDHIINLLETKFGDLLVRPSSTRHWYDFIIHDIQQQGTNTNTNTKTEGISIPCNLKISQGGTNNALSKKAIVYTFSTLDEKDIPSNMSFNKMIDLIENNKRSERSDDYNKEYIYIYIDKKDRTVLVRSICDVQNYVSNPQNWLQINWTKEKQIHDNDLSRDDIDTCYMRVRDVLRESLDKFNSTSNKL
jgi:hypothetical protein